MELHIARCRQRWRATDSAWCADRPGRPTRRLRGTFLIMDTASLPFLTRMVVFAAHRLPTT